MEALLFSIQRTVNNIVVPVCARKSVPSMETTDMDSSSLSEWGDVSDYGTHFSLENE